MTLERIGRYQVKSVLGQGGMATVYHAYDPNFERDVAIKVLTVALQTDAQFRTRFEREAKTIALLEHPAIVPLYDFGEQDGQPYIVMRYMGGNSLADRLKRGALSLPEAEAVISRIAPALDAAHARGIVHRDIKPGNILFDKYDSAFLSDFGIARLAQQESVTLASASLLGTPAYMSPEQVQGEGVVDGRSDVYALGVVLYQMLSGQQPYRAETPVRVMMMHLTEPVPDLSASGLPLPPACRQIVAKAMAKRPEDRYQTAGEIAQDLLAAVRGAGLSRTPEAAASDITVIGGQTIYHPQPLPPITPPPHPPALPASTGMAPRQGGFPWLAVIVIGLLLLGAAAAVIGWALFSPDRQGNPPAAVAFSPTAPLSAAPTVAVSSTPEPAPTASPPPASSTPPPADTPAAASYPPPVEASPTPQPTELPPTPTQAVPVIGGADKVAFLLNSEVWAANLDGSSQVQLTSDGGQKANLQWSPDGRSLIYVSGKCAYSVELESGRVEQLACFNYIDVLKSFELSPDGSQVAVSLDNQMYLVTFDPASLSQVNTRSDLAKLALCQDFAPYKRNLITGIHWSRDGKQIAARLLANLGNGQQGDLIQVLPVDGCTATPRAVDNFPAQRFTIKGYDKQPVIQHYGWDGVYLFAFTNIIRNDGFGDLYIYNTNLHKAQIAVNPVEGSCCYRDPSWSPDGSHLVVAFQDIGQGANSVTRLYLIPFGTLGTGASYQPLPLPEITDPRERPQPVLRPAQ